MANKSIREDIRSLGVFEGLDDKQIDFLANCAIRRPLDRGELLFSEKSEVTNVYIVLDGKVSLFRISEIGQKRVIFILGRGEIINEVIFDGLPSSINCEAFEGSIVIGFNKNALCYCMSRNFELTQNMMNSMGKKIRRLYRQLKNTVSINMDKKLAAKLWKLSRDYGITTDEGTLIDLEISVTYLSEMLGSTRETVSRCISDLQRQGLIMYKGRHIVVRDREELSAYFKGFCHNPQIPPK